MRRACFVCNSKVPIEVQLDASPNSQCLWRHIPRAIIEEEFQPRRPRPRSPPKRVRLAGNLINSISKLKACCSIQRTIKNKVMLILNSLQMATLADTVITIRDTITATRINSEITRGTTQAGLHTPAKIELPGAAPQKIKRQAQLAAAERAVMNILRCWGFQQ